MTLVHRVVDLLPSVEAELNYLVPMEGRPRNYAMEPPPGVCQRCCWAFCLWSSPY